jgi:hypothetical protein
MAKEADAEAKHARKTERRLEKLEKAIVKLVAKRLRGDETVKVSLPNVELVIDRKGGKRAHRAQKSELRKASGKPLPPDTEAEEPNGDSDN